MPLRTSSRISAARIFAATLFLSLATTIVHATPVVMFSPTYPTSATEVDGVVVGGVDYNVTFPALVMNDPFDGQPGLAFQAANELIDALNASPATSLLDQYGPGRLFFDVLDGPAGRGIIVLNATGIGYGQQGAWAINSMAAGLGFGAVFTPVSTTPEPSSLVLLGTGAAMFWNTMRRRRTYRA